MFLRARQLRGIAKGKIGFRAALIFSLFSCFAGSSYGQVLYGSLTGNVTDGTGAAIPTAKVEAANLGTGINKTATTDDRGVYLFNDLLPGTYRVTISAPSFASRVQEGVAITLNNVLRMDVTLSVSQVIESIKVSASSVTLQTDRADINNQIQAAQIADLPLINSQPADNKTYTTSTPHTSTIYTSSLPQP